MGAFFNAGQVCSAATRIIVEDSVHDAFVERFAARAASLRLGNPLEAGTMMGPMISPAQMDRMLGYVEAGRTEGAVVATGGARHGSTGFFVQPTVFIDVDPMMKIAREEIFGPVVCVSRFRDEAEAVRMSNGTAYSLTAAVWTRDVHRAHRLADDLGAGTVWVNTHGPTDARLPWGGMEGQSGIGRDLGRAALEGYTETKTVWVQLDGAR